MTLLSMQPLKAFVHRLACLQSRAWLPPALLLLALSTMFIFGGDRRGYFYRDDRHYELSAKNMAIVENLSPEHHFVMFRGQTLYTDGKPTYRLYNRFPIGSYALIKLATLPFGDNMSAKIYAARMLMLAFFAAAALMAYLSLRRLAFSPWIALTATLLAFSSAYPLYYSDVISSEALVDVFAILLVFHGMAIFEQEGRFRQLLAKACIALLLGWHVYGLLLPFIAFGMMLSLLKTRVDASVPLLSLRQLKHTARAMLRSRYLALGAVALLFGVSVLTLNFTNEYFALNRETPLTELPSFDSMMNRTTEGFREEVDKYVAWSNFLERQFYRIGVMFTPYAFSPSYAELSDGDYTLPRLFVILGIAASVATLIGLPLARRYKILLASLALSGFCWAALVRYNAGLPWSNHEAIFHIGIALTLISLVLLALHRLLGERLVAALAVISLAVFVLSGWRIAQPSDAGQEIEFHKAITSDFQLIRNITDGKIIWPWQMYEGYYNVIGDYYLAAKYRVSGPPYPHAPFVVTTMKADGLASLTPQNQIVFLYDWNEFQRYITETIAPAGEPIVRSDFDVYLNADALIYVNDDCRKSYTEAPFFLAPYPVDESDLPAESRQYGFENHDFRFHDFGFRRSAEQCIAIAQIPDYDIARISTGQYIRQADGSKPHLWNGSFNFPNRLADDRLRRIDETIAQAGAPIIGSDFDVYLDDGALIYSNADCPVSYTKASFFLALYPADESDLPAEARQRGFDNRDFGFHDGGFWGNDSDRCIAVAPLPDYDIARIYTGQYIQGADGSTQHLWEGDFNFPDRLADDHMRRIDETIAQSGAPIIRSDFDVYLDDGALIYSNADCPIGYTNASFFLALYPADENDLSAEARQRGFDNRDFSFHEGGFWGSGARCIAVAPLPDYDIARIYTGQYIQGADGSTAHLWEGNVILPEAAR